MNCASVYESSDAISTPATVIGSSKDTLLASGQALQTEEVDISTAPPAFTPPTGIDTSKVMYSMSMDINIEQTGAAWRSIMNSGDPDWPAGTTSRRPALFITGTAAFAPANRILVAHGTAENPAAGPITTFTATPGTYFNLTWVVNNGKLVTYINGQKDATGSLDGAFTWGTANAWKWNPYLTQYPGRGGNTVGPVKVKNVYWFNKALSATEVATIAGSGSGTTSTYAPEPYSQSESSHLNL